MELQAALSAVKMLDGELDIVTDSTYVANCFRDGWWRGWERRGWRNSAKQPVANRDLWEPLIEAHKAGRFGVPRWVKGHSGDVMNDLVDRLAVASSLQQDDASGATPPAPEELGPADTPGVRSAATGTAAAAAGRLADLDPAERRAERRKRDGRIPTGTLLVAGGMRTLPGDLADLRRRMAELFAGFAQVHDDLRVLTGLRPGAEALAGEAALEAEVDWVAVLPYPDPQEHLATDDRARFLALRRLAPAEVVLERKVPATRADRAKALARRDAWLAGAADLAVMVWDQVDEPGREMTVRFERAIPDDVVILTP
jgi:hypothetical protein